MDEIYYPYPESEYNEGVLLDEYNDSWSLVSVNEGQDGEIYKKWGYPQRNRKPIDKVIPWKVKLGDDKREAARCLKFFLEKLVGRKVIFEE